MRKFIQWELTPLAEHKFPFWWTTANAFCPVLLPIAILCALEIASRNDNPYC